eukprot:11990657-Alexandrium_andersonii.AAC.1
MDDGVVAALVQHALARAGASLAQPRPCMGSRARARGDDRPSPRRLLTWARTRFLLPRGVSGGDRGGGGD